MSDEGKLRLVLRGFTIADEAPAEPAGGGVFVTLRKPPPVGSVVEAFSGGSRKLLQVTGIIESDGENRTAGFFGREREDDTDGRLLDRVGSEKLAAANPREAAELGAHSESTEDAAPAYAVPAPVLDPEPSEPIDLGRPGEDAEAVAADSGEDAAGDDDAGDDGAGGDAPKGRGKKRKGRKRG